MSNQISQSLSKIVNIQDGPIQGLNNKGVNIFLGIPYAQSISGKNRFLPPQKPKAWTEVKVMNAYADNSPQEGGDPTSGTLFTPAFAEPDYVSSGDNCLALNVWAPEDAKDLPVMVWLHGGGWTSGSGSAKVYEGHSLASRGDVIVVTINHRLGASGFTDLSRVLGSDFAQSSNLSIKDMIAALEWVRDNIGAFGGNSECVTIFGESGGGWKVNTLMGVPSAKGLFHRAAVQSGPLTKFLTPQQADDLASQVLEPLGINKDNAEKLNEVTFEDMLKAEKEVMSKMSMGSMMSSPGFPIGFWPVLDGELIPEHVYYPQGPDCSKDVPLLIGTNGTEFTLFMFRDAAAYSLDDESLDKRLGGIFGPASQMILKAYRRDFPDYDAPGLWFKIFSDYAMSALSAEIMDVKTAQKGAPVYAYRLDWKTPVYDGKLYAPHTLDIPFVFNNVLNEAGRVMTLHAEGAEQLGINMSEAWVNFAKTGQPSAADLPEWPVYDSESKGAMHFNTQSHVGPYIDPQVQSIFRQILWKQAGLE